MEKLKISKSVANQTQTKKPVRKKRLRLHQTSQQNVHSYPSLIKKNTLNSLTISNPSNTLINYIKLN